MRPILRPPPVRFVIRRKRPRPNSIRRRDPALTQRNSRGGTAC